MKRRAFFDMHRHFFGPLKQAQVTELDTLITFLERDPFTHPCYVAHMFAEVRHETDATYAPIREYGTDEYLSYLKRKKSLGNHLIDDALALRLCGRGHIQTTGYFNYKWASELCGHDFIADPDALLIPEYSYKVMKVGMEIGRFTGKKLSDFWINFTNGLYDHYKARKIINGIVPKVAEKISRDARKYEMILDSSGWF